MKTALIAGSNSGIGLAFSKLLIQETQIQKIIALHRAGSSNTDLKTIEAQNPDRLTRVEFDACTESSYPSLANQLKAEGVESLDLVINCIGCLQDNIIEGPERKLEELSKAQLMRSFEVNSLPTALLAKYLKPLIRLSKEPTFVALSAKVGSISDNHMGGWYSYRSSKAALNMIVRGVAIELSRINSQSLVLALHPGTTDTKLSKDFLKSASKKYKIHSPQDTAKNLWKVIQTAKRPEDSGKFFSWDQEELPW